MKVTVHQPEYLPWIPFFDRIQQADVFVILDDVGYQKNGFINRNKIKTKKGAQYLTVPVQGRSPNIKINEALIDNSTDWGKSQLSLLKEHYSKAPYFKEYYPFFEETFGKKWEKMADLDNHIIKNFLKFLGITIRIEITSQMNIEGTKSERLINICKQVGSKTYFTGRGPGNKVLDLELFKKEGIEVVFQDFVHPVYQQQYPEQGFLSGLSVIDLLFNEGPNSLKIIQS